jgi:hypothetical protein
MYLPPISLPGRRAASSPGFPSAACLLVVALSVAACRNSDIEAPLPQRHGEAVDQRQELPLASLAAPVVLDLTGILQKLEEAVPLTFGDMEDRIQHPSNDRIQIAFVASRTPFVAEFHGAEARISATLEYQLRAWYDPPLLPQVNFGCGTTDGEIRPRAVLELRSPLRLGEDWTLRSKVRVARIEPLSQEARDRCDVTAIGIDLTGTVMNAATAFLNGLSDRIDAKVAEVDLRSKLQGVWETLQEPHELTDGVWLLIDPVGVTYGATEGEGNVVTIPVGLTARPRIVVGDRPRVEMRELPLLEEGEVGDEARILVEGLADYDAITEHLASQLAGYELTPGGNLIRILGVAVHGIGDGRVAIEVRFEGTARGTIFLVGTPQLNIETKTIEVPDLEFDLETRHLLVGGLAWIGRGNFEEALRERAQIPIDDAMALAEVQLQRGINRSLSDEVTVEGEVLGSELIDAIAGDDGLVVRAEARVRALLRIQQ